MKLLSKINKKQRKLILWIGIPAVVVALAAAFVFMLFIRETDEPESRMRSRAEVTRAEWVGILMDAEMSDQLRRHIDLYDLARYFPDVDETSPQYTYIQIAAFRGCLDWELDDGIFMPEEPATREFVARTTVLAFGLWDVEDDIQVADIGDMGAEDRYIMEVAASAGILTLDGSNRAYPKFYASREYALYVAGLASQHRADSIRPDDWEDVIVLAESVIDLSAELRSGAIREAGEGLYEFEHAAAGRLNTGDVFYMTPTLDFLDGIVLKVSHIETSGGVALIHTEQPDIDEAFEELDVWMPSNIGAPGGNPTASGSEIMLLGANMPEAIPLNNEDDDFFTYVGWAIDSVRFIENSRVRTDTEMYIISSPRIQYSQGWIKMPLGVSYQFSATITVRVNITGKTSFSSEIPLIPPTPANVGLKLSMPLSADVEGHGGEAVFTYCVWFGMNGLKPFVNVDPVGTPSYKGALELSGSFGIKFAVAVPLFGDFISVSYKAVSTTTRSAEPYEERGLCLDYVSHLTLVPEFQALGGFTKHAQRLFTVLERIQREHVTEGEYESFRRWQLYAALLDAAEQAKKTLTFTPDNPRKFADVKRHWEGEKEEDFFAGKGYWPIECTQGLPLGISAELSELIVGGPPGEIEFSFSWRDDLGAQFGLGTDTFRISDVYYENPVIIGVDGQQRLIGLYVGEVTIKFRLYMPKDPRNGDYTPVVSLVMAEHDFTVVDRSYLEFEESTVRLIIDDVFTPVLYLKGYDGQVIMQINSSSQEAKVAFQERGHGVSGGPLTTMRFTRAGETVIVAELWRFDASLNRYVHVPDGDVTLSITVVDDSYIEFTETSIKLKVGSSYTPTLNLLSEDGGFIRSLDMSSPETKVTFTARGGGVTGGPLGTMFFSEEGQTIITAELWRIDPETGEYVHIPGFEVTLTITVEDDDDEPEPGPYGW